MPNSNDFSAEHPGKLSKNTAVINNLFSNMATSKGGNTPAEAQSSSNSTKNTENSLIKHQGQKWHQVFDFDKMIKQIRATVSEKQHHRNKGDTSSSSNNGKSATATAAASSSKSNGSSNSKNARSIRQVQRLSGNDMHYYGIVPKKASADVIVCSICRGIYTMVGFNNHMIMQHPSAWGAVSSKLANAPASNDMINLIPNDNSQDCLRDGPGLTAPEILGSPSDLSGIMSTSSNASSSSSSISTTSSTYTATPRHKSSKSGGTTAGSSSSGGSSSTSGSRSRSKQSRHSSSNNHAAAVGIHTSSNASTESAQASSKSSKKNSSNNSSGSNANSHKNENANNPSSLAITGMSTTITNAVTHSGKHSKDTSVLDTLATTPIALYSSSSNSSCSLPPTPKLSTSLAEVKSPAFVAQESVDSPVSSSSLEYERISAGGKSVSGKPTHTSNAPGKNSKANGNAASSSTHNSKEVAKVAAIKDVNRFDTTPLTELDQAVSSITENPSLIDKKSVSCIKNIMDTTNISMPPSINNIFQMPTTTTNTENNSEKLLQAAMNAPTTNATNMNVVQTVMAPNYVVPQEVAQTCEDALPHNTSDDNSILTFDDMFDSKFINEILSTADTDIPFDEGEFDTATAAQHQQQQHQQQQQTQDQHQVFQQQVQPTTKRMRYDETLLTSGQQQQQIQHQQQGQSVEITGEFVAYQQQQQQQQYVPYNVATLDDLKLFNSSGPLVEQHHLQHATEQQQQQQQQQQLTAIDAMQLQQLLYQQQTLSNHYDTNMVDNSADSNALAMHQQQYDHSGVVSAKQLMDICASVDMKSNKLTDFATLPAATGGTYEHCYDNMAAHFQLYNIPSLTDDDNVDAVVQQMPTTGGDANLLLPNVVNGMQRATQQYVLPGGVGEDHLIYEITDNNQVAVISQQRQQQMLNEFLTQANYDQVATDINDPANAAQMQQNNTNVDNINAKEVTDIDDDLLEFDYSLLETFKTISSSSSNSSNSGGNAKSIKTELNSSASSSSKYYDDVYLNAYLYAGIPKPIAINCFGLIKMPFAAATTFRKHILNARKANNSPITLSGGGGINGIVCSNSAATARLTNNSKSMQNYFANLNSSSNSLVGSEFSIGSITITNSSVSQSQLYAAQQKQQNASNSNSSSNAVGGGSMEITFNTNSNGCGSAMSPVSSLQRSRCKSGNATSSGGGGATLVRSKSQTGAPVAVVTPTSRLPPPPRPSTAGPVLAQNSKTIFVSNTPANSGERIKFIKRCMPLIASNNTNNSGVRNDGSKRPKFSPRQIADLLGGISTNNSKNNKTLATQPTNDAANNGPSNNNMHETAATGNNNNNSNANTTTNADEQLKLERVAHFYERRRKLYDLARNNSRQQQLQQQKQQEPQRTQPPHVQQNLLKQQQQLFKMLTDYGQLNAAVGCKSANATPSSNNNGGNEVLRISV
ncbi:serine-rich adhesin for platelets [Zeugodacus cucurbitae]|uniref:serine-rich adhesin for platelets n=1 Tax=Zeugodacus cucurbitae TaxID=28588 RepID=UPI0023D8ECC5|nr:serine-rich adhesin for platelets [Zeugodacus cucurbitae]XP_011194430.2 serine-rich adhesin for platelets [Zeugodacus cucurbitae]XP_028901156.2 serine-rich adhesin for platelets [Zeugodacus cucurbitae]XP_054083780.1 serine-rich adhesin for platelets [Zeugodacus cucurbitae]XP_054083781.1 serine-rich adhesin for platelets [Zeugodacus cucurbitae]XP_054083782.1 serine-rich adhesin for platelets [Zeugodacus cucurbitae]